MKTYSIPFVFMLVFSLLMLPGCDQYQGGSRSNVREKIEADEEEAEDKDEDEDDDAEEVKSKGKEKAKGKAKEKEKKAKSSKPFTAFTSLEFPYIDMDGRKNTITFYRNDSVNEFVDQITKKGNFDKKLNPNEKRLFEKLRTALQLLYGRNEKQDTALAVALLHKLADVKKPYTHDFWTKKELEFHAMANYFLSLCYQDGVGVAKDKNLALSLLKEACFFDQFKCEKDHFYWEEDLDDVAFPLATLEMAVRLLGGMDVSPNYLKGIALLEVANVHGNSVSPGIQMKLQVTTGLPERFRNYDSKESLSRSMEGFTAFEITQMRSREKIEGDSGFESPVVAGTKPSEPMTAEEHVDDAMDKLLEYQDSFIESIERNDGQRSFTNAMKTYIENIENVDINNCPNDFQARFNNYIQAEKRVLELRLPVTHPNFFSDKFLQEWGNSIANGMLDGSSANDELQVAKKNLIECAQRYGVDVDEEDLRM